MMTELKKDKDIRSLSYQVQKLTEDELVDQLKEYEVSTHGPKELLQDILFRTKLLTEGYSEAVPSYDWDNEGEIPKQSQEAFLAKPKHRKSKTKKTKTAEETASATALASQLETDAGAESLDEVMQSSVEQIHALTRIQPTRSENSQPGQVLANQLNGLVAAQVLEALLNSSRVTLETPYFL